MITVDDIKVTARLISNISAQREELIVMGLNGKNKSRKTTKSWQSNTSVATNGGELSEDTRIYQNRVGTLRIGRRTTF